MIASSQKPTSNWLTTRITRLGKDYCKVLDPDLVTDYAKDLKKYPESVIDKACTEARRTSDFFPSISFIIRECERIIRPNFEQDDRRYLCNPNCKCEGTGFIYGKYFSAKMQKEYEGVYPCPERMKRGKSA